MPRGPLHESMRMRGRPASIPWRCGHRTPAWEVSNVNVARTLGVIMVSLLVASALVPGAMAGPDDKLNLTLKKTVIVGDWGNQKSVLWIFKVTNEQDSAHDYYPIYVEALYKGGCHFALAHKVDVAEYLYWPHDPANPTMVDWKPGTYFQIAPQSFTVGAAGGSLTFSVSGWSYVWTGGESRWKDGYYQYDAYNQQLAWTVPVTCIGWGKVGNAVIARVTQGGYQWARVSVEYVSGVWWWWGPWWDDKATTPWIYLAP